MTTRTILSCPDCGSMFCRDHLRPRIDDREPKTPLAYPTAMEHDDLVRTREAFAWSHREDYSWCPTCRAYRHMEVDEVLCDNPRD